jgi:predicted ATPase
VRCLVTSRERLQLQSEFVYQVEGLPYSRNLILKEARVQPAVELLVLSAQRVKTGFELNEENLEAVLRICRQADGMPLALELAAAWLETLSIQTIANEIQASAVFLEVAWQDLPVRQRSIRAVFDWSWRLLTPFEQEGYFKLSVFRGDFTREAARTVCGVELPLLLRLVQKSLVRANEDRFELHELVRQFVWEKLAEGAGEAVQAKHSEYFLNFIGEREEGLRSDRLRQTLQEIRRELDNIRLAWHWATEKLVLSYLEKSVFPLWRFYFLTGLQPEGERAMQAVPFAA